MRKLLKKGTGKGLLHTIHALQAQGKPSNALKRRVDAQVNRYFERMSEGLHAHVGVLPVSLMAWPLFSNPHTY